jgi:hypothetical protein
MSEMSDKVAQMIWGSMYWNTMFPYDKNRRLPPPHMREATFSYNLLRLNDTTSVVTLGNDRAMQTNPYYQMLQDAEIIHYGNRKKRINMVDKETGEIKTKAVGNARGWSTSKSKTIDSTTDRNRRGSRSLELQGKWKETSTWYVNKHYKFIDRILADIMPKIATQLGGTLKVGTMSDINDVLVGMASPLPQMPIE